MEFEFLAFTLSCRIVSMYLMSQLLKLDSQFDLQLHGPTQMLLVVIVPRIKIEVAGVAACGQNAT